MVGWKPPSCGPRDHKPEAKAVMATASKNNLTDVHIFFSHPSNTNYRESRITDHGKVVHARPSVNIVIVEVAPAFTLPAQLGAESA